MENRILLVMLIASVLAIMARLAWRGGRWFLSYQVQLAFVIVVAAIALVFANVPALTVVAWVLFGLVVLLPPALLTQAHRQLLIGRADSAARLWKWASLIVLGKIGQRYSEYSALFSMAHTDDAAALESRLDEILRQPQPVQLRGNPLALKFLLYCVRHEWRKAVTFFESIPHWGSSEVALGVRLQAARAYAELGNLPEAIGRFNRVLGEPQSFRLREPIFLTRVAIYALAGDLEHLRKLFRQERKLLRRLPKAFAPYWLGRCHATRGERAEAATAFRDAYDCLSQHHARWKKAVEDGLARIEGTPELNWQPFAATDAYRRAIAMLEQTEEANRGIQAVLDLTHPTKVITSLVAVLIAVHLIGLMVADRLMGEPRLLIEWGSNSPRDVASGQWWRLLTATFLHAGWLHLFFNTLVLLTFGSAVEKAWGRTRTLVIFLLAATAGNALSYLLAAPDADPSVGASGGVFGLLATYWIAVLTVRLPKPRRFKLWLVLLVSAIILVDLSVGVLGNYKQFDWLLAARIDNWAHAGGFAVGLLLGWVLRPRKQSAPQTALPDRKLTL